MLLGRLSRRRPVFHSEADFQHALAWEFQLASPTAAVRLEQQVATRGSRVHLDLLVKNKADHVAVELKYKTRSASLDCGNERFELRNQAAQDLARYDFLKDVARLERYIESHPLAEGYAVLLTNDPSYWSVGRKADSVDAAFRLHDGRRVGGDLSWGMAASQGTMRTREDPISIQTALDLRWNDFSHIGTHTFRYLLARVRGAGLP